MSSKQRIVHGRGLSNLNLGIFVCSFDVCRASKPVPSINYAETRRYFACIHFVFPIQIMSILRRFDPLFSSLKRLFKGMHALFNKQDKGSNLLSIIA